MLLSIIGAAATTAITPLYFKKLFDLLAQTQAKDTIAIKLIQVLVMIAIIEMIGWVFWRLTTFVVSYFQTSIMANLAMKI